VRFYLTEVEDLSILREAQKQLGIKEKNFTLQNRMTGVEMNNVKRKPTTKKFSLSLSALCS
jgi:hypothetical protein